MKRSIIVIIVIAVIALIAYSSLKGGYNNMVSKDEAVKSQWSQVENVYQRRLDLIPNLVNTVKGAADFEKSTFTAVAEARSKVSQITVDPNDLTPEKIKEFQSAQGELSQALGRLMMVTENYPELKANANFRDLQVQLEGTENRITQERRKFNEVTQDYNTYVRKFPNNLIGGMFGFGQKGYFAAEAGANKAPEVKF
ncbi:MAG: LemA family protein [Saprospiraceae bacterium]|jgi:LemA protein|uniref:LemA family protein n=1 Tax=Candidatus Brachybacter algidus TaxID=2982024 RepID=UPI001B6C61DB|nr:LemA family protein [Candidatus Brachybacter algidus]MBP7541082.1 LemA family protein [Saprospiraceae bacterium]MBK6374563.1 LemA family protein [Candidatus Brachybacter algidus]MBK6449311.1 LemA family protein [Candidatus Brachybacter algidus]MBK7602294.1 LemA family protein [Candidatus Brachybacter algidus]MBK8747461.1 LemA family protein [Candidatus Brachybacter algidus]